MNALSYDGCIKFRLGSRLSAKMLIASRQAVAFPFFAIAILVGVLSLQPGCATLPGDARDAEFSVRADDRGVVALDIAWVDHRARFGQIDDYEQWNLEVGLAVHMPPDADDRLFHLISALANNILHAPQKTVEVRRIDGRPVELAIRLVERYTRSLPPDSEPAFLEMPRRFEIDDGSAVYVGVATVALAEELPPGVYQIRLNPEYSWWAPFDYRMRASDQWHTFILVGIDDDRRRLQRVPWRDLPAE